MIALNKEYIKQTLTEEPLWKVGESDTFIFNDWNLTLRKEEEIYSPFIYSIGGTKKNGSSINRRYTSMQNAFLHILNQFNDNVAILNDYKTLEQFLNKTEKVRKFKIGDEVNWTNSNGVDLGKRKVIGYDTRSGETYFEYTYFIGPIDSPWFSVSEEELKLYEEKVANEVN